VQISCVHCCVVDTVRLGAGRWPLWLSPRQVATIPVAPAFNDYAEDVNDALREAGFEVVTCTAFWAMMSWHSVTFAFCSCILRRSSTQAAKLFERRLERPRYELEPRVFVLRHVEYFTRQIICLA